MPAACRSPGGHSPPPPHSKTGISALLLAFRSPGLWGPMTDGPLSGRPRLVLEEKAVCAAGWPSAELGWARSAPGPEFSKKMLLRIADTYIRLPVLLGPSDVDLVKVSSLEDTSVNDLTQGCDPLTPCGSVPWRMPGAQRACGAHGSGLGFWGCRSSTVRGGTGAWGLQGLPSVCLPLCCPSGRARPPCRQTRTLVPAKRPMALGKGRPPSSEQPA